MYVVLLFDFSFTYPFCVYVQNLQSLSSVVIVFEPVIGSSTRGDIQHSHFQLVQCFIRQSQVPNQMPNALITT